MMMQQRQRHSLVRSLANAHAHTIDTHKLHNYTINLLLVEPSLSRSLSVSLCECECLRVGRARV